jgi:hypothetical protein
MSAGSVQDGVMKTDAPCIAGGLVRLEPELEAIAAGLGPAETERLARVFYRWSKQLWTKSAIQRRQQTREAQRPPNIDDAREPGNPAATVIAWPSKPTPNCRSVPPQGLVASGILPGSTVRRLVCSRLA